MAAAKKPQSKYHIAKIHSNKLDRISALRAAALEDAPKHVNELFTGKRLRAIAQIPEICHPMMLSAGDITESELAAAAKLGGDDVSEADVSDEAEDGDAEE